MLDFTKPRELGDFGNAILLGPYRATAAALHPAATLFGLPNSAMVLWGACEDEDGVSYCICREMPAYLTGGCWVMSNAGGKGMVLMPESAKLWSGALAIDMDGERIDWRSADIWRGATPALEAWFAPDRAEYREGDLLELAAVPAAHGYQFYEPTHGQGTANHVYSATGHIGGKAVTGWLGFNTHFQKPGMNYRISPMARGGQMVMWLDVGNVFEDGSWEQGPIVVGRDGFGAAWITSSDGRMTFSNDVRAEFELGDDGFPTEVRFGFVDTRSGEKQSWIWRPKPGSNMVELPGFAPHLKYKRSAEGTCLRAGENRKLAHSSAWPEFQADERLEAFLAEQGG